MSRQVSQRDEALNETQNRLQRVWDLPVRLVHWLLAGLIAFSWWSVHTHHTSCHIWSGCAVLSLLIFRLLWGVVGSSTARFSNFVRGPRSIANYLRGGWSGIGHNPLGALSVVGLLSALCIQVGLGLVAEDPDGVYTGPLYRLVSSDTSDKARDLHALWFNVILGLVALHLAAIIYYHVRGRPLTWRMITGHDRLEPGTEAMKPAKWWLALVMLAIAIGITRWVIAGAPPFGS